MQTAGSARDRHFRLKPLNQSEAHHRDTAVSPLRRQKKQLQGLAAGGDFTGPGFAYGRKLRPVFCTETFWRKRHNVRGNAQWIENATLQKTRYTPFPSGR
jgi:hypothetical protein